MKSNTNRLEGNPALLYDLDGVICDFVTAFCDAVGMPHADNEWAFYKQWGWTHTQFHEAYVEHWEEILREADVFGGASRWRNHFRAVRNAGVEPIILTHRTLRDDVPLDRLTDTTMDWLDAHGFEQLVTFANCGDVHDQSALAKEQWLEFEGAHRSFLGACEDNVLNLANMMHSGKLPLGIIVARPYNEEITADYPEGRTTGRHRAFRMNVTGLRNTFEVVASNDIFGPTYTTPS